MGPAEKASAIGFSGRIAQLIRSAGNASAFARLCGISESVVRKWRDGLSDPSRAYLERIAKGAGVSVTWLVTGEEPMRPDGAHGSEHRVGEPLSPGYMPVPPAEERHHGADTLPSCVDVGPLDRALVFSEDWLRVELGVRREDTCLMRVSGDSMEPALRAGDVILVDRRATRPDREGIYVLRMKEMLLVKRLQALPGGLVKVSGDNPAADSFQVKVSDIGGRALAVLGRVVWCGRRL